MKITRGKKIMPRRVLLYGTHGIGKSSWAAQSPDVLFLNLEDGLNDIDAAKTDHLGSLDSVIEALTWLASQKHEFRWVAIDTADWLEALVHHEVALKAGKATIGDIAFGAGYKSAQAYWDKLLTMLDWLRTERGMGIILLAHTAIKKYADPMADSYDRYQPALHETAAATLQEWADEVLFACYRVTTRKQDEGFGKERVIAGGSGERLLRCTETPGALAKNRLGMPDTIEFSWAAYQSYFPQAAATTTTTPSAAGNISGVVVDGSSKKA
jgi:hypothetical protein